MLDKILFLSGPVPEDDRFINPAFVRSGNLAVGGIAEGLRSCVGDGLTCWTSQAVPSWPRYRQFFIRYYKLVFESGLIVRTFPAINVIMLRELCRGIEAFFVTLFWSLANFRQRRCVVTYNFYTPPFGFPRFAAWLTRTPIVPIVFDIGLPLTSHGGLRNWIYARAEKSIKCYCRHLLGAAVIVEHIQKTYLADRHALLLDGGIGPEICRRLFPLQRPAGQASRKETIFVLAGRLVHYNGVDLVMEAMRQNKNPDIRLVVAGNAASQELQAQMNQDPRISYVGLLDLDKLFDVYRDADVVLNIRLTQEMDTRNWFPSKFIEALAVGRLVLSTNMGHMKEVYADYCRILDEETPQKLSRVMDALAVLSRDERDAVGARARSFMLEGHTWDKQTMRLLRYCDGVCSGKFKGRTGMINEF